MTTNHVEKTSRVPSSTSFHRKSVNVIARFGDLSEADKGLLLAGETLPLDKARNMVENVTGVFGLPHGIAANFRIDDEDFFIPMVVEEPSVVAAASHAAKLLREDEDRDASRCARHDRSDPVV